MELVYSDGDEVRRSVFKSQTQFRVPPVSLSPTSLPWELPLTSFKAIAVWSSALKQPGLWK